MVMKLNTLHKFRFTITHITKDLTTGFKNRHSTHCRHLEIRGMRTDKKANSYSHRHDIVDVPDLADVEYRVRAPTLHRLIF